MHHDDKISSISIFLNLRSYQTNSTNVLPLIRFKAFSNRSFLILFYFAYGFLLDKVYFIKLCQSTHHGEFFQ